MPMNSLQVLDVEISLGALPGREVPKPVSDVVRLGAFELFMGGRSKLVLERHPIL